MPAGRQRGRMLAAAQARRRPGRRGTGKSGSGSGGWRGWWRGLDGRQRWVLAGSGAVSAAIIAGVLAWAAVGSSPAPRARQYIAFAACLLTDSRGLASPQAAAAWAGMEEASAATRARVQYQPVMSGSTEGAAAPYLAGLIAQQCRVVVAAGPAEVAAVQAYARRFPSVRFAAVDAAAHAGGVTDLRGSAAQLRSSVAALVRSAVASSHSPR